MVIAARLSECLGMLSADETRRITGVLARAGLPVARPDLGFDRYLELMGHDKKIEGGKIRFVLLRGIGNGEILGDVPPSALRTRSPGHGP